MKKIFLITGMIFALTIQPAFAQDAAKPVKNDVSAKPDAVKIVPVLEKLRGDDKKLSYDLMGKRDGVEVWLLSGPGVMQMVYVLPNQEAIVGGALVSTDGQELASGLTRDFMKANADRTKEILAIVKSNEAKPAGDQATAVPTPVPALPETAPAAVQAEAPTAQSANESPSETLWRDLGQTGYVSYGTKTDVPVIYAILDPAQDDSKKVWTTLAPLAKQDRITLHVVPLALMTGDSIMEIATVLGGENPPALWEKLMTGQSVQGGSPPDGQKVLAIDKTVKLAQRLQLHKLPLLVYRTPNAGKVRMLQGFAAELGQPFQGS